MSGAAIHERGRGQRQPGAVQVLAVLVLLLAGGCRATWTPRTLTAPAPLQWPFAPAAARVTYLHAFTGLARDASVAGAVRALAIGSGRREGGFVLPVATAQGPEGRVAVADTGCRCVHLYRPGDSTYVQIRGTDKVRLQSPVGVAFAGRSLFVTDSSGALFAFDADGTLRFAQDSAAEPGWKRPTGIAWDAARARLYVVDTLAHAVRVLDADGRLRGSFGSRGAGAGELNFPTHVAVAPDGDVYVTDALNFRISIFDPSGNAAGSFGRHGDGSGDLAMPKGLAVDANGVVYVVDALFDTVQLFDRRGAFLLAIGGRGTGFGEFWLPSGLALDEQRNLRVCDTYNRRIQVFRVENGHATGPS